MWEGVLPGHAIADTLDAASPQPGLRVRFSYRPARPYVLRHGAAFPAGVRRVRPELLPDDDALVTMGLQTQNGDDDAERHNAAIAEDPDRIEDLIESMKESQGQSFEEVECSFL
jgi:hypothetical protein